MVIRTVSCLLALFGLLTACGGGGGSGGQGTGPANEKATSTESQAVTEPQQVLPNRDFDSFANIYSDGLIIAKDVYSFMLDLKGLLNQFRNVPYLRKLEMSY